MESSSNDSFFWTDASNDSGDNNMKRVQPMEAQYEGENESGAYYKLKAGNKNTGSENENETKKKRKKAKKRKHEATHEISDCSQPERKQIKLEPESDVDFGKKIMSGKEKSVHSTDTQDSILYNEDFLNVRVKQEQSSCIETKKKKKRRRSNSNTDDTCKFDYTMQRNMESLLDLQVKQEMCKQETIVEPEVMKCKQTIKHKRSIVCCDKDIANETKSVMSLSDTTVQNNTINEQKEFSVIEEKFIAEETIVEKPRKKKYKREAVDKKNNNHEDSKLMIAKKETRMTSEENYNAIAYNDISLESNDFTCNNIVNSTVINNSTINLIDKQVNTMEELLKGSKNLYTTKISDRIRFEEDDNSCQQESLFAKTTLSSTVNMFLKVKPHVEPCVSQTLEDSLLTKDDEMWALTWPHKINVEKLRNVTVSFEGKCKIKIDGQTYEGVPNEDLIPITLVTHQHGQALITNVPVKSCMSYHKRIPKLHIPNNSIMVNNQTNFTPLPETKCRHPLFGTHYKKKMKIATHIAERLQAAKVNSSEIPCETFKKKKYKKDKHKPVDIKMEDDSVDIKSKPSNKKRKRMHSNDNDVPLKKAKKVKHIADSPAVWESEKAIEDNLFNF